MIYIKAVVCMLLLAVGFKLGFYISHNKDASALADKDKALITASGALHESANALRLQNADNKKRMADAEARAKNADVAKGVAEAAAKDAAKRAKDYADRERTARRRPGCEALLNTNVEQTCGRLF